MTGTHRYRKNSATKFRYGSRNCVSKRSVTLLYIFDDSNDLRQCTASPSEHLFDMARAGRKKRSILPPSSVGRINRASLQAALRLGTIPSTRSAALLWPNCSQTLRLSRQPCQGEDCERDTTRKCRSLCRPPDRVRCHGRQATGADLQQVRLAPHEFFVGKLSLIMLGEQLLQFLAYRAPGHGPLLSGGPQNYCHGYGMDAPRAVVRNACDSVTSVSPFGHAPVTITRKGGGGEFTAKAAVTSSRRRALRGTS